MATNDPTGPAAYVVRPAPGHARPTGVRNVLMSVVAAMGLYEVLARTVNRALDEHVVPGFWEVQAKTAAIRRREVKRIEQSPVTQAVGALSLGFVAGVLMRRSKRVRT